MTAVLLALALFAGFSAVGLAVLAALRADTSSLRIALTAPALGSAVAALATFVFSHAGMGANSFGQGLAIALIAAALAVLAWRRPRVHPGAIAVVAVSVGALLLMASPMFSLGLHWLGNANDDMSNYSLSAQWLLHHPLASPLDFAGLVGGRDYSTVLTVLQAQGARPGSDLTMALTAAATGLETYSVFMPLICALAMCGVCSAGALAAGARRPWWVAVLAGGLLAISPLATYGVLQQLIAQVFGLALATALLALLLRPEIHSKAADLARDVVPIGLLFAGVILVYIELASTLAVMYALFLAVLAYRRELALRPIARLWISSALMAIVILNSYLLTEISFLHTQAQTGASISAHPPLFGYMLVPSALPLGLGLQAIGGTGVGAPLVSTSIVVAALIWLAVAVGAVREWARGSAIAAILVGDLLLALYLAYHSADFGLFKLAMYVQPFLAAAVAACFTSVRRRLAPVAVVLLVLFAVSQISTQQVYVQRSINPTDLLDASAPGLIPAFRAAEASTTEPIVAAGSNPFLLKIEAVASFGHPLYFLSRDVFSSPPALSGSVAVTAEVAEDEARLIREHPTSAAARLVRASRPQLASVRAPGGDRVIDRFAWSPKAEHALASGRCRLALPTRALEPFNGLALPASDGPQAILPCGSPRDLLTYVNSTLGENFYLPSSYSAVSFYPFESDFFFPQSDLVGFGRYALFQTLGPTPRMRMVLSYTFTLRHDGSNAIPPSSVVGRGRYAFPVVGRGSARVISPPLSPQMIDGDPYLLLDIGEDARVAPEHRGGVQGLFGAAVPLDPRALTGYVRDVSLISAAQYAQLRPPLMAASFPAALADPDLQYSGIYEDGWVGRDSYLVLGSGPAAQLRLEGSVPVGGGGELEILVNGRPVARVAAKPGPLSIRSAVPASSAPRKLELRFTKLTKLPPPDLRPVSAFLTSVGFVDSSERAGA